MTVRTLFCLAAVLPSLLFTGTSRGHWEAPPRIEKASRRIEQSPADVKLYLHRGSLYYRYRQWELALQDFETAARLAPSRRTELFRAQALRRLQRYDEAQQMLAPYLARNPSDPQAQRLQAFLLVMRGDYPAADRVYEQLIASLPHPTADIYVEWINAFAEAGPERIPLALERTQTALHRMGPVPSLQLKAVRLEAARENYAGALEQLQPLLTNAARPEPLLLLKGDLLRKAGRIDEATATFREALKAWHQRPAWERQTAEAQRLQAKIQRELP